MENKNIDANRFAEKTSATSSVCLPVLSLDLSDEVNKSDSSLVFHPVLDKDKIELLRRDGTNDDEKSFAGSFAEMKSPVTSMQNPTRDNTQMMFAKQILIDEERKSMLFVKDDLPTELELDSAIMQCPQSISSDAKSLDGSSLTDSSSSGSSLMSKLRSTMTDLKDDNVHSAIADQLKSTNETKKEVLVSPTSGGNGTIRLDLRPNQKSPEKPFDEAVFQRYGRSSFSDDDDNDEDEEEYSFKDMRSSLKRGSHFVIEQKPDETVESSNCLVNSVNCMLQNIDNIIHNVATPKNDEDMQQLLEKTGDVRPVFKNYSEESEDEYVMKRVVFDEKTGKEDCVLVGRTEDEVICLKNVNIEASMDELSGGCHYPNKSKEQTDTECLKGPDCSIDYDMNTQVIDWEKVLKVEQQTTQSHVGEQTSTSNLRCAPKQLSLHAEKRSSLFNPTLENQHAACNGCDTHLRDAKSESGKYHNGRPAVKSTGSSTDDCQLFVDQPSKDCAKTVKSLETLGDEGKLKTSKNKKKKKNKGSKSVEKMEVEKTEEKRSDVTNEKSEAGRPSNERKKEMADILNTLAELKSEKVLFEETVSFEEACPSLPHTNKEKLVLKINLEACGMVKMAATETLLSHTSSDVYIGLVTLFVLLLKGSRWDLPSQITTIMFEVVSMQQVCLDGQLLLIVGVVEKQTNSQMKSKRSKLGSSFYRSVLAFLNNNSLEELLQGIWSIVVSVGLKKNARTLWEQVEAQKDDECEVPGKGRLSDFVKVTADTHALQRFLSLPPSLTAHRDESCLRTSPLCSLFNTNDTPQLDYTCITLQNVWNISPKFLSRVFKQLREESVEIVGLRIGYVSRATNSVLEPILTIGIHEFGATSVSMGKQLFSDCEQLNGLSISFQMGEKNSIEPVLNYVINSKRAHRQMVYWFGPRFASVGDARLNINVLAATKGPNSNFKKKWSLEFPKMSYIVSCPSYSCMLVSSCVPSSFLAFVISYAGKKGLQLKSLSKHYIGESMQKDLCLLSGDQQKKNKSFACQQTLLVFCGSSSALRLLGLAQKLTLLLQKPITGETLHSLCHDKLFKYKTSHNITNENSHLIPHYSSRNLFTALSITEPVLQMLSSSTTLPPPVPLSELYNSIAKANLNVSLPQLNIAALIAYGKTFSNNICRLLCTLFGGTVFHCISSWRQASRSSVASLQYVPPLELLGLKHIQRLTSVQASDFSLADPSSKAWCDDLSKMVNNECCILLLKASDKQEMNRLAETVGSYLLTANVNLQNENIIFHRDGEYVTRLMFQYFYVNEVFCDDLDNRDKIASVYLPPTHVLFKTLNKMLRLNAESSFAFKKELLTVNDLYIDYASVSKDVFQVQSTNAPFPINLLLSNEMSYAGLSIMYKSHNAVSIAKAVSRVARMGFQICGLKFPVFKNCDAWLKLCVKHTNAILLLNKLVYELEKSYQNLIFHVTKSPNDAIRFLKNNFKQREGEGGIFHSNYIAIVHGLHFEGETVIKGRQSRDIDWDPECGEVEYAFDYMQTHRPSFESYFTSASVKNDELTVILITEPLLRGEFCGERLPSQCLFPEVWHTLESLSYRTVAAKMTQLPRDYAQSIVGRFDVTEARKNRMVELLSAKGPFVVMALLGSCILSNFLLTLERNFADMASYETFKEYSLVPTSKFQVDFLLLSFFDHVLPNAKFQIRTCVV